MLVDLKGKTLDELYALKDRCSTEESKYIVIHAIGVRKKLLRERAEDSMLGYDPDTWLTISVQRTEYQDVELELK